MDHLKANGFRVKSHSVRDPSEYRVRYGVPDKLGGCHTATVEGYVLEGHVPGREIKRLLKERPAARGLAVPGMPRGSPGMEGPVRDPYEVLLIGNDGKTVVYAKYGN